MLRFHNKIYRNLMWRNFLWKTQISSIAAYVVSLESCSEFPRRYFTLYTVLEIYQPRPYTVDTFQLFVVFKVAFSRYSEQSLVGTDNYFRGFVLWTHTLHRQIMLWVKEWNSGVPHSLSQCNSNGCYRAAKQQRTLFRWKRVCNVCS